MTVQGRQGATFPAAEGVILCTSTTHPPNPYVGLRIFETDTGKKLTFQSATTGYTPDWNVVWGAMAQPAKNLANQATISTIVDVTTCTITYTAVANRSIEVIGRVLVQSTVAADVATVSIANAAGADLAIARVLLTTVTTFVNVPITHYETPAAGSVTYKLRIVRTAGTGTLTVAGGGTGYGVIAVNDLGPNGVPV